MVRNGAFGDVEKSLTDKPLDLFTTSICNPAGNICDSQRWATIAHKHGIPLIVDNTVATPFLCRPFEHGADIVVHSLTKYIGGHGTTVAGVVVDSGKFDWAANKAKFPMLNEPDPSYHGVIYTEALGAADFLWRRRAAPLRSTLYSTSRAVDQTSST